MPEIFQCTWKPAIPRILALAVLMVSAASRRLDSTELLCGQWDLSIHCDSEYFQSELFPPRVSVVESGQDNPFQRRRKLRRQAYPCRLEIHPNGTFCLSPKATLAEKDDENCMAVRGNWMIKQNPYCVTDRFYDEIVLKSYPRVRKEVTQGEEKIVKQGLFTLHGRLFGHFSAGRLSRRLKNNTGWYAKGRISRGLIQWENKGRGGPSEHWVKASFSGHRLVPPTIPASSQLADSDDPY